MTFEGAKLAARLGVPELECLVPACRDHPGAVGAKGTGQNRGGVAREGTKLLARLGVPDLEPLPACRDHPGAVGAEGTGVDPPSAALERAKLPARLGVPERERLVPACRDHPGAVGAEGTGPDLVGVARESANLLARLGIPELERLILACRDHPGAVGAEVTGVDIVRVAREGANEPLRLPGPRPGPEPGCGPRHTAALELRLDESANRLVLPLQPVVKLLPQQPGLATQHVHLAGQGPAERHEHWTRIPGRCHLRIPCHPGLQLSRGTFITLSPLVAADDSGMCPSRHLPSGP